jgi:hypothetical protein
MLMPAASKRSLIAQQVGLHAPRVRRPRPSANHQADRTVAESGRPYVRRRIAQDAPVGFEQLPYFRHRGADVVAVADAHRDLEPARAAAVVVGDGVAADLAVGHDRLASVRHQQQRVHQVEAFHGAFGAAGSHVIAHAKRPEQRQKHAPGEIAERTLQGQSDRQPGSAECRDHRRRRHAQHAQRSDHEQRDEEAVDEVAQEPAERGIEVGAAERALREVGQAACDRYTYQQHQQRPDQVQPQLHGLIGVRGNVVRGSLGRWLDGLFEHGFTPLKKRSQPSSPAMKTLPRPPAPMRRGGR